MRPGSAYEDDPDPEDSDNSRIAVPRWTPEEYRRRPQEYDPRIAEIIVNRVANGESLSRITTDRDMPFAATFLGWTRQEQMLSTMWAQALKDRAFVVGEEVLIFGDNRDARIAKQQIDARRIIKDRDGGTSGRVGGEDGPVTPDYEPEVRRRIEGMASRREARERAEAAGKK